MFYQYLINFQFKSCGVLILGSVFGTTSLLLLIITMLMQASHLSYSASNSTNNTELWNNRDAWMLNGLLGGQVEIFAFFLKTLWYISLTYVFFINKNFIFGALGVFYSLLSIFYFFMLLDKSLLREIRFMKKFKLNTLVINLETVTWFLIIIIWLVIN